MNYFGRHRLGDPDESGTLALIDGLILAVEAERSNAQFAGAPPDALQAYAAGRDHLGVARRLVREARELKRGPVEGGT